MKRVAAAFSLVAAIIICAVIAAICLVRWQNEIVDIIDRIEMYNKSGDSGKASAVAEELTSKWVSYEKKMSFFVSDEKLDNISSSVAKIPQFITEANDELNAELESIRRQLKLLCRGEMPIWYNLLHRFFRSMQTIII